MTALRGFTLSQHSYESDENVAPAQTVPHSYHCPAGHTVTLRFAHDAEELPTTWDCPKCGRTAHADETTRPPRGDRSGRGPAGAVLAAVELLAARPTGTCSWSAARVAELEALLEERLALLRQRGF